MIFPKKGFSIIMALGIITILMVAVLGISSVYVRELKLSKLSYDEVIAAAGAEGAFEYAMLKIKNHPDGFADTVTHDDVDGKMLELQMPRSKSLQTGYTIQANSTDNTFQLESNSHLIVPLFTGDAEIISGKSKNPEYGTAIQKTTNLEISGIDTLPWTIVAIDAEGNSTTLGEKGNITLSSSGIHRIKYEDCYNEEGEKISCSDTSRVKERLLYFHDERVGIQQFLLDNAQAYLMIYNSDTNQSPRSVTIQSHAPFSLPAYTVEAHARNNDAMQVFQFSEDKSKYFDAIKYGVYNEEEK